MIVELIRSYVINVKERITSYFCDYLQLHDNCTLLDYTCILSVTIWKVISLLAKELDLTVTVWPASLYLGSVVVSKIDRCDNIVSPPLHSVDATH